MSSAKGGLPLLPLFALVSHTCRPSSAGREGMNIYKLVHPYEEITIKTEELVLMEDLDERLWRKSE